MEISVIYITYRPGGIDILADSLANQTFKDYELIIIDDYSVDRREVVRNYLEHKGIPVAYIGASKPKCFPDIAFNVSNAINTGFLLSTKEVVVILQDYQWLPPDCLEKIAQQEKKLQAKHCIILPGQMWENSRERFDMGVTTVWNRDWKGLPSQNGCKKGEVWVPESWEFACIAIPWDIIVAMNGYPEWLDCDAAHRLAPLVKAFETAGGLPYVDKQNFMHIINHRAWAPKELWHQAKREPRGNTEYIERENCFDLKTHTRGRAYWVKEPNNIFEKPEYWCGELGYRPGPFGSGYTDFPINQVKADYILRREPRGKVLDIGCAYGYIVKKLRAKGIDAWGVDISQYALSKAPEVVKPYLKHASADRLPFGDKEFDIAFSASTFEHMPQTMVAKAISEAVRVAGRGIIAVTPGTAPHFDEDITHRTKQPLSWWREQFPPEFEVRNDADEAWQKKTPQVHMHRPEWVQSKATLQDKILEVGCAENSVWKDTKFNVATLDKQINPAIEIFPEIKALAEALPFKDGLFDIVCVSELLEHVPDPQKVLREAVRVARKKLIITVPAEHEWPPDLKPFWNPGHIRFYTPETLEEELISLELPFHIEVIRHDAWAWLGAEVNVAPGDKLVKINLGSFVDTIGQGWQNWDILQIQQHITQGHIFKQCDVRTGFPLPDNSVDLIRTSHLIEHLTLEEAQNLLREIYRVLKTGSLARISTPDIHTIIKHYFNLDMSFFNKIQPLEYIQAPTRAEKLSRLIFGEHKAAYDFEMLKNFLEQAGFEAGKIYRVSPGFSYSEVMKTETEDQHIEINLTVEAVK